MGRRRGEIEDWLKKIFFSGRSSEYVVFIRHRVNEEEIYTPIPGESITDVRRGFIYIKSGEVIPFHRVVEIRNKKGDLVYKRP